MLTVPKVIARPKVQSIAVLTSGGDAPGMNAAIRAVVRFAIAHKIQVYGVYKGYSGLLEGQVFPLGPSSVANIIQRGGTILKTDRCEAFYKKSVRKEAAQFLQQKGIDGLVVIGGDGSFTGAHLLEKETGFRCIGVPGTIDNDINGTDETIGFDTAVNTAIESIDRIRDTASSHDRIFLVEVMGRSSGFIAINTGIGGGAESIIIPEVPSSVSEIASSIERGLKRGKMSSIVVVAEGHTPGLAQKISAQLEKRKYQTKVCILGHTQRGGAPTAYDRLLASVLGASAVAYLANGKSGAMVGVQADRTVLVPFARAITVKKKNLQTPILRLAQILAS